MKTDLLTRHAWLMLSTTVVLTACGGQDDTTAPPPSSFSDARPAAQTPEADTLAPGAWKPRRKFIAPSLIEPISKTGIRGDVLAQALRTQASQTSDDGGRLESLAVPWTAEAPKGAKGPSPDALGSDPQPSVLIHQSITPNTSGSALEGPFIYTYDPYPVQVRGYRYRMMGVSTDMLSFSLSAHGPLDPSVAHAPLDTEVLQLGKRIHAQTQYGHQRSVSTTPLPPDSQRQTLESREPYRLHRNEEIQWLEPLHRWGEWGHPIHATFVDLYVRQGDTERQFRLCLRVSNSSGAGYQQRSCSLWEVPVGWVPGQALVYRGQSITHEPAAGQRKYWNTEPASLQVDPKAGWRTTTHHAEDGISGALLAAMFDTWSPRSKGMSAFTQLDAYPSQTTEPFGFPEDPTSRTNKVAYQSSRVTQYADGSSTGGYAPAQGVFLYTMLSGDPQGAGQILPITATPDNPRVTVDLNVRSDTQNGQQRFTLPRWIGMAVDTRPQAGAPLANAYQGELFHGPETVVTGNTLIPYTATIKEWARPGEPNQRVSLRLEGDFSRRQADLCWDILAIQGSDFSTSRSICTRWKIPENWQPGQPLDPLAYDIQGDGYRHWNNLPR